jgi:hypothetical protein
MAVEIVLDTASLLQPVESDCMVVAVADYVPAVQRIKGASRAGTHLRVLVRHPVCAVWLQRFAGPHPDADVRCTAVSARELLAQRWQTTIPEWAIDEAIVASGFLDANIIPKGGQSYADIVLANYWGEFFTFVSFPFTLAGDLVESLDNARWQANRGLPLVMQALEARRQSWLDRAKRREQRDLIQAVFDDPQALKERLGCYKVVRHYPASVGRAVLGTWHDRFKDLNLDPTTVRLDEIDIAKAVQQVVYYLNSLSSKITSQTELEAALDQVSGCLTEEFAWIREQLRTKTEALPVTASLVHKIAERFRPIQEQIQGGLDALQAAIPPPYPSSPVASWDAREWLRWAVVEYLPYRFWLEENDRWDLAVAGYASTYADWFYEHYTELRYQEQRRWVFDVMNQVGLSLSQGHKVLLVVIDNFNFKYLKALLAFFARQGFRVTGSVEPVWATLPTTTEVSKHSLVAGEPDLRKVQGRGYEDILAKDWRHHLGGYQLVYLSKLGLLKDRQQFDADLILLNYLPVDDVLHKDESQIGTTHTGQIQAHLETLVETVGQFARRARVEQDLVIAIASDHGSTKMLPDAENLLDDKFYAKQAQDRHHRYISVPDARAENPTSYDREHCYILPAKAFGTRQSYFVPRGYGVFIRTGESIYVHGGLTPEETIVPLLRLVKTELKVLQPTFHLPGNVVRYGVKANLLFNVGNPNDSDMTVVTLRVAESDLPGVLVDSIPAGQAIEVTIPVRIRRQPGVPELADITIQGTFGIQGQAYPIEPVSIPVEVRSLMATTEIDFDV